MTEYSDEVTVTGDNRLGPVVRLAESCGYEREHSRQVAFLALRLFDELTMLHGLGEVERFWLESAGLLHDIGWNEGGRGHHKVALEIILNTPLLEFDRRERLVVGLVAHYHRKALPALEHEHFAELEPSEREVVRRLAVLLRLADGLDYRHLSVIRDLHCKVTPQQVAVRCEAEGDATVECERARQKAEPLLGRVFGKALIIETA
jgi:exopolyphosphatase/guanosine-5'-triphosphate,3'-diphosphate pyrophosphatase